ncbi:MAG: conjugal transfer protein TraO [Bacteroidota bacterium]
MKRILPLLFLFSFSFVSGQQYANYSSSLELTGGYTNDGYAINGGFNYYLDRYSYVQGAVYLSFAKNEQEGFEVPYNNFTLNVGYFRNVYGSLNRKFYAAIGGGAVIGYEVVNNGNEELEGGAIVDNRSNLLYGAFIGAEIDIYLSETFSFLIKANEYYHPSSDLGTFTFYGGAGIRYILF